MAFLPGLLDAIERVEAAVDRAAQEERHREILAFEHGRRSYGRGALDHSPGIKEAVNKARRIESNWWRGTRAVSAKSPRQYAYRRLDAGRRMVEYKMYARLFSFWHVLHIPLFFMLLIAGFVHVIAINVY